MDKPKFHLYKNYFFVYLIVFVVINNYICITVLIMDTGKEFVDLADSIMKDKLGIERYAYGCSAQKGTFYHIYQKSLTNYKLEIKYTVVDDNDPNKIKECRIKMKFIPSSNNKDTNGNETYDTIKYKITGFKIVGAKDNNLIIEPFGDTQKIVTENKTAENKTAKTTSTNDLKELNKSKKYLLPLDNEQLKKAIRLNNPFMEYNKSLLGLGCITGDEQSCCRCCYW